MDRAQQEWLTSAPFHPKAGMTGAGATGGSCWPASGTWAGSRGLCPSTPHGLSTLVGLLTAQQLGSERKRKRKRERGTPSLRTHRASRRHTLLVQAARSSSRSRGGDRDPTSWREMRQRIWGPCLKTLSEHVKWSVFAPRITNCHGLSWACTTSLVLAETRGKDTEVGRRDTLGVFPPHVGPQGPSLLQK